MKPLTISLLSVVVSMLTYYRNSARAQSRREQVTRMRVLAGCAVVYWDQLTTVITAQVKRFPVDDYMFASMRANARLVTDALNAAVGVGLLHCFLDEAPHGLQRYTAFYQGLVWAASLPEGERRPLEDYTKQHLIMGMVRLLDTCVQFRPV